MEYYQFSASSFAEKIGVQRSSISHILSGRNKPSLDFVIKITSTFNEVDVDWLINGKGNFPSNIEDKSNSSSQSLIENKSNNNSKKIERIVVFYNDGTFDEYFK